MKRVIIDYKKLDKDIATLLIESYPHGYGDDDIILLKKPNGELIEAVEVRTVDTIFLVKISKSLSNFIANFEETMEKELELDTPAQNDSLKTEKPIKIEGDFDSDDMMP